MLTFLCQRTFIWMGYVYVPSEHARNPIFKRAHKSGDEQGFRASPTLLNGSTMFCRERNFLKSCAKQDYERCSLARSEKSRPLAPRAIRFASYAGAPTGETLRIESPRRISRALGKRTKPGRISSQSENRESFISYLVSNVLFRLSG